MFFPADVLYGYFEGHFVEVARRLAFWGFFDVVVEGCGGVGIGHYKGDFGLDGAAGDGWCGGDGCGSCSHDCCIFIRVDTIAFPGTPVEDGLYIPDTLPRTLNF